MARLPDIFRSTRQGPPSRRLPRRPTQPKFVVPPPWSGTTPSGRKLHVVKARRSVRARFRVTNTGSRTGTEVAQVYLSLPSWTGEPPKRLVGWERVTLAPGKSRTVEVENDPDAPDHPFSHWSGRWRIPSGMFKVSVGRSAGEIEDSERLSVLKARFPY